MKLRVRSVFPVIFLSGCVASAQPAEELPRRDPLPPATAAASGATASYTAAQAERGRTIFNRVCSACHGLGEFRGRQFELAWIGRPVGDFLAHISTAMPQDNPGSLPAAEYAAVVAYVMQLNGVPVGSVEVSTDVGALSGTRWRQ